jgi:hypothetical protein
LLAARERVSSLRWGWALSLSYSERKRAHVGRDRDV